MRGNGIQAFAFIATSYTSQHFSEGCSVVYHMKLPAYLLHAVALLLPSIPSIAPRLVFVFNAFSCLSDAFSFRNDVRYALVKENGL